MRQMSLAVVGMAHPNKRGPTRAFGIALCRPGDSIDLVPEPENPADEWAVAVYDERKIQLGYLTSERAPYISKMLAIGRDLTAIFQHATPWGAVIRVAFDGDQPVLPAVADRPEVEREGADNDIGFYPDEVWPDQCRKHPTLCLTGRKHPTR